MSPALHSLLDSCVDYAGLFPPAGLGMTEAVRNHAAYLHGPHRRMLGRFILPVARLGEFEAAYSTLHASEQEGWRLSALAGADPVTDRQTIQAFHARWPRARIVSIEARAATPDEIKTIVAGFPPSFEVWIEVPAAGDTSPLLAAIKATGRGAKLRTGGVVAGAFPSAADIVRFLAACRARSITAKATAGLHHPLTGEYRLTYEPASPAGPMFGFINLFLAAVLVQSGGNETDAVALLTERTAAGFRISDDTLSWRDHTFPTAAIATARRSLLRSFGSCSFTEPVEGLQGLGWL